MSLDNISEAGFILSREISLGSLFIYEREKLRESS